MQHVNSSIDPTYLRYIYDSLNSGDLQKENHSNLPEGLIGVYEKSFPESIDLHKRIILFDFLKVFAIVKRDVSASFVAQIISCNESVVVNQISSFSSWFNSPVSGKFHLYHERLRIYVLGKISQFDFDYCNDRIITQCQKSLINKSNDEFEYYALEFLSDHLFLKSMITENGEDLLSLAYNNSIWNRQLEISKVYDWSKKMLHYAMSWASKYDNDQVIECALHKVSLYHIEQNDTPLIVELVAQNDIETALHRIESFGGNDKEGLQRKFILYMLCFMELTLLSSKDMPFSRDALVKLLKSFDENIPIDHERVSWNLFFSSNLIFQISCSLAFFELDFLIIYKRTTWWELNFKLEDKLFDFFQLQVLSSAAKSMKLGKGKIHILKEISSNLSLQGHNDAALNLLNESIEIIQSGSNQDIEYKNNLLIEIYVEIGTLLDINLARELILELYNNTNNINDVIQSSKILKNISIAFCRFGDYDYAFKIANEIHVEEEKARALVFIYRGRFNTVFTLNAKEIIIKALSLVIKSNDLIKEIIPEITSKDDLYISLDFIFGLNNKKLEDELLLSIINELGRTHNCQEAFRIRDMIIDHAKVNIASRYISISLIKESKFEEALDVIHEISDELERYEIKNILASELINRGDLDYARQILLSLIEFVDLFDNTNRKYKFCISLFINFSKIGMAEEMINLLSESFRSIQFKPYSVKKIAVIYLVKILSENSLHDYAVKQIIDIGNLKLIGFTQLINDLVVKSDYAKTSIFLFHILEFKHPQKITPTLFSISLSFIKNSNFNQSLKILEYLEISYLADNLKELISVLHTSSDSKNIKNYIDAIIIKFSSINDLDARLQILKKLSILLIDYGYVDLSLEISKNYEVIIAVSSYILNQGKIDEALDLLSKIVNPRNRIIAFLSLINVFKDIGRMTDVNSLIDQAFELFSQITNKNDIQELKCKISISLAYLGKISEALEMLKTLENNFSSQKTLFDISKILIKQRNYEDSIMIAKSITHDFLKSKCLMHISIELFKMGFLELSEKLQSESISLAYQIQDEALESVNSSPLYQISLSLWENGFYTHSFMIAGGIQNVNSSRDFWLKVGGDAFLKYGFLNSLRLKNNLEKIESSIYFGQGLALSFNSINIPRDQIAILLNTYFFDSLSLENILQNYVYNDCFFFNTSPKLLDKYNKTFNIQWLLDLKS